MKSLRTKQAEFAVCLALLTLWLLPVQLVGQNNSTDWVVGDAFVAIGNGSYQVWHSANPTAKNPTYTLVQTINDGIAVGGSTNGGATAGCGFDLAYRFFGTNFTNSLTDRYAIDNGDNNHSIVQQLAPGNASPGTLSQSVVTDAGRNLYIGYAGGASAGFGTIEQWAKDPSSGLYKFVQAFSVPVDNTVGPGWIDLASDGVTIFYTSQGRKIRTFNTATQTAGIYADLGSSSGTLFAIRILPPGDGSNGVLVADQSNVKLVNSTGVVQKFNFGGNNNLQALSLDPLIPSTFWVGDATSNNFFRVNMASNQKVSLQTGTGNLGGICLDGGFNAAELNGLNSSTQAFALSPPSPANPTSNTLSFSSPFTHSQFTASLANLQNNVTATVRDTLVDASLALSDPTVFSFNPGNPAFGASTVPGNMICDQTVTTAAGFPGKCEVFEFEANPNSGFTVANTQITPTIVNETALNNLRLLRNLDEDITTDVDISGTKTKCVYTVNQQTTNPTFEICGNTFSSPANDQNFVKNQTSTITFKFKVAPAGQCPNGQSPPNLQPLLLIVQLQPTAANGVTPAPIPQQVIVAGNSGGPPVFVLSGNTWQLQVKTTDLAAGFTYAASMVDLTGTIGSLNVTFTLQ